MTERREIKQRSPAVWARVREAYLAGEPAASVARRFDVGLGNLRYRANAEGWTRKAMMAEADAETQAEEIRVAGRSDPMSAAAAEPPVEIDPADAFEAALARAGVAIAAGRGAEAAGLLKAAETLVRLREASPPEHLPTSRSGRPNRRPFAPPGPKRRRPGERPRPRDWRRCGVGAP